MSQAPQIPKYNDPNTKFSAFSYTDHSKRGWMTRDIWTSYLKKVRSDFVPVIPGTNIKDRVNKILLLCDSYPVHFCDEALNLAKSLNIKLLKIPPGLTDACQPLDCRVFWCT